MAKEEKQPQAPAKPKERFFRCREFAGLKIVMEQDVKNSKLIGPRFAPYSEIFRGDIVYVGYWKGSGEEAEVVKKAKYTEEISEKEFKEATDREKAPKKL